MKYHYYYYLISSRFCREKGATVNQLWFQK